MHTDETDLRNQILEKEKQIVHAENSLLRNGFHLMPPTGWMNDPNGLCQLEEEYHIFFQYAPFYANGSGPKGWGHYVTKNWIDFEYLPVALLPDEMFDRDGVYSGSTFIDEKGMHIFYTGNVKLPGEHDYITSGRLADTVLVESRDGRSFEKKQVVLHTNEYPKGVSCHVRDPKVWKENGKYYMVLGARTLEDRGEVFLYTSDNMKQWTLCTVLTTSEAFGYMWECPDLFPFSSGRILSVSPQGLEAREDCFQNKYQSGYFLLPDECCDFPTKHGKTVLLDSQNFSEWDKGFDFYAPQTFVDGQGRRILIGWAGMPDAEYKNKEIEEGWQHCLTVPRRLTLKEHPVTGNLAVYQNPIYEIETLRTGENVTITEKVTEFSEECIDIVFQKLPDSFEIEIADGVLFRYDKNWLSLSLNESCGLGRELRKTKIWGIDTIRMLVDSSVLEIYVNDGEMVFTTRYYKSNPGTKVRVSDTGMEIVAYPMREIHIERNKFA